MPGVHQHRPQVGRQARRQHDVRPEGATQELREDGDLLAQVDDRTLNHLAAGKGEQLLGEPARALRGLLDAFEVADRARPSQLLFGRGLDLGLEQRGHVQDDREEVVEVVGDSAGQLAKALQPLGLLNLALRLGLLGDILLHHHPGLAVTEAQNLRGHLAPDEGAVLGPMDRRTRLRQDMKRGL